MNDTQVDHTACSAPCCPALATHSRSTTGGDWFCFLHFAAPPGKTGHITAELQRLAWLVRIVRDLRALPVTKNYPAVEAAAHKEMALCQRNDLRSKDSETASAWMIRLEGVLSASCKAAITEPQI
jgi:hypothetical protein